MHRTLYGGALALLLIVSACGGDDESGDSSPASTAAASDDADSSADGTTESEDAEANDAETNDTEAPADADDSTDETDDSSGESESGADGEAADPSLEPVRIGWVNTDEGAASYPGITGAARTAAAYANAELGGINGHPIELVECAVGLDEATNAACGAEFANDDDLTAIATGLLLNGGGFYAALQSSDVPMVGGVLATSADFAAPNLSSFSVSTLGGVTGAANYIAAELAEPGASVALVYDNTDAGDQAGQYAKAELERVGLSPNGVAVNLAAGDMIPTLTSAGAADADVIFFMSPEPGCIQMDEAMGQLGLDAPIVTLSGCTGESVFEQTANGMEGWYIGSSIALPRVPAGSDDEMDQYYAAFEQYGDGADPLGGLAFYGYSTVLTLQNALDEIDPTTATPADVTDAIVGFTGPVALGPGEGTVSCPGDPIPASCGTQTIMYQVVDGELIVQRDFTDIAG